MKQLKIAILTCIMATVFATAMQAQGQTPAPDNAISTAMPLSQVQMAQIAEDMTGYISEVMGVQDRIASATPEDILELQRQMQAIDVRWQAYTQIEQIDIAGSPALMELLSQYKLVFISTNDSLTAQKARLDAVNTYTRAQTFISQMLTKYHSLSSEAMKYSLLQQTAAQLADVKAQEAMLRSQVEENYQKAVAASQLSDEVKAKMPELQKSYIEITTLSEEIQAAAYKPWMQRIKDYVLTFAGIAIILIFLNFVIMRLKSLKQARDLAKKYGNMLNSNDEYPTI